MTPKTQFRLAILILVDVVLVNLAAYLAYVVRGSLYFDGRWRSLMMEEYRDAFWQIALVVTIVRISTFFVLKLYKPVWRYASVGEFVSIFKAVTLGTAAFIVVMYVSRQMFYSRGVVGIDWALNLLLIGMTKFSSRIFHEYWPRLASGPKTRVLIVGAGSTGQNALREIMQAGFLRSQKHYSPVGFIDDDPEKQGKSIHSVEVLGTSKDIPSITRQTRADEILIAISSAHDSKVKEITSLCEKTNAKVSLVSGIRSFSAPSRDLEKVLLIGGAGYIGSVMVRKMLQKGYRVRILDSLIYGKQSIAELYTNPSFELIVGDFRHVDTVVRAARGVDAIIHLGGIVGDPACQLDPEFAIEVNSAATRMIKGVCIGFGIKRFIFASTCSVYGADDDLLNENSPLNPLSVYARSKVDSERILLEGANGSLSPTVFRMATAFGISYRPRFDLVINLLTAKAAVGEEITIFGGYQWRPFIHVDDVAKAFIMCLESPLGKVGHQTFNVGANELNCQISDIGKMISDLLPGTRIEHQTDVTDKRNYRVCFDRIRNTLNFNCDKTIQDGISEIKDAIQGGLIGDYRNARFSNYLWLEKQPEKREILF
jgi:nucleoside-diphosphate-sugar epimerase